MAKHSSTHFSNRSRKACESRVEKTVEKFYGKQALADTWKGVDNQYWRELQNEADALRRSLEVKGVTV